MQIPFVFIVTMAVIASPCAEAADCGTPERVNSVVSLTSVVTAEMQQIGEAEQGCLSAQALVNLAQAIAPNVVDSNGYVPRTKDDNTPWRFDMNQNGKRMTAGQFDAWMKAKGIHVATGKPAGAAVIEAGACQPSQTVSC